MKNKGVLSLILVFCLILGVAQIGFYKLAAADVTKTFYVSANGADSKRNGTNAKPYKTVNYAITSAKSSNPDTIIINVKDYAEFDFETEFSGNLVIQGSADDAQLQVVSGKTLESQSSKTCLLNSNLTFNNIKILSALNDQGLPLKYMFVTQGKNLVFGEGTCVDQSSFGVLVGRANDFSTDVCGQQLTVESLTCSGESNASSGLEISVGVIPQKNTADCVNPLGKVDININSGDVKKVSFLNTNTVYGDDVIITWFPFLKSDDQVAVGFEGENNSTFKKSLQVIMNNSAVSANIDENLRSANADGGKWIMLVNNDYSYIEATDVPGKFKVHGDLDVKAVNMQNGEDVYVSSSVGEDSEKYLDLSENPGEYAVTSIIPASVFETLYVSSTGDDNTGNGSQLKPFATIAKAEEVIAESGVESGKIILLSDMSFTSAPHTKMITISGNTGDENLVQTSSVISVNGPTTFKNFNINDTVSHISNGNEVVYENITMSGSYGIFYFGNIDSSVTSDNNITINGLGQASWKGANVRVGPKTRGSVINGNLNIVLNNGYFNQFWVFEGIYNGNVNITLNGGTVYGSDPFLDPYLDYTTTYNGAYQLILNNGFSPSKVSEAAREISAAGGSWFMYSNDKSGAMLSATDTPGTFAVEGGKTAVAKERTSKITYYSHNKKLTVPAGVYDVTYSDENPSENFVVISHKGTGSSNLIQKVSLEKGKTYNVAFDYIDGYEQLDKNIVLTVFDNQNNKVCSSDNNGISLISEDEDKYHRTYSFVNNGDSDEYYIGFSITGDYSLAISNLGLYRSDVTGVNLIKNGNFKNRLNNWIVDGYSPDGEDTYKSGSELFIAAEYYNPNDYFEKVIYDPGEELGTKKMLYIENYSGYRTILQRFYKIIKPDTKYAFECSISSQIDYKLNVRKNGSREAIYKLDPEKTIEVEKETELGTVYYKQAYYEFSIPEAVDNQIFIGFEFASGQTAIVFDLKLYEVDDPEKKNIFVNPDFEAGLDEWIWGWTIWYNHDADSSGLLEWQGDNGKLILKKYDYKNLVTYFDDRYYIDGTWWNDKDVAEPDVETGSVTGFLKDSNGKALTNVTIAILSDDYRFEENTDLNGVFNFASIPVGEYTLFALDSSGDEHYITNIVVIKDGKYHMDIVCDISGLVINLSDNSDVFEGEKAVPRGAIRGTIYTPDRKTVSGLTVFLSNGESAVTDEDGNFEFVSIPGGDYRIGTKLNGKIYVLKNITLIDDTITTIKLKYDPKTEQTVVSNGVPLWAWIVIAALVVCFVSAAVLTVFLIVRKKKKASK